MTARTITSAAELDALPFPSVVAFPGYGDWHKRRDGRWLCDDGDEVLTSGALALVANGELAMIGDPSAPVIPAVSDAAVDAAFNAGWEAAMRALDRRPPTGWSTFGSHVETPDVALEFYPTPEMGVADLPMWERPRD